MTAHVRKGFDLAFKKLAVRLDKAQAGIGHEALAQRMFRAGVRFEQGRHREWASQYYAHGRKMLREHGSVRQALATALELLSRTPAGKREADKLREVLK